MATLYSKNGGYPEALPSRLRLPDGRTRTDVSTFTTAEIALCGYVAVSNPPAYDAATQVLTWDGSAWGVRSKTNAEMYNETMLELAATDSEYDPRWIEDSLKGDPPHERALAWIAKRAQLRTKLNDLK